MRKLLVAVMTFLVSAAPLAVEAVSIQGSGDQAPRSERWESNAPRSREANAPRVDRRESNAPRGQDVNAPRADRESNAPRSSELSALDRVDQGNPAP